jgi:hypothetical protein
MTLFMLSEIALLYGPTRTTAFNIFNIFVTKFRNDTTINSAVFKREKFGRGKQISASYKGQFFVFFVVIVDANVAAAAVTVVCIFVKAL